MTEVYSSFSVILETHLNVYSTQLKKSNVYSPRHFWSSYKVVFGHLYSVKLTVLTLKTSATFSGYLLNADLLTFRGHLYMFFDQFWKW